MRVHSCKGQEKGAAAGHPCGRAIKALREAGHDFEIEIAEGYRALPWTRRGKREHLYELTGQRNVPVLEADDGEVVVGSGKIVAWAKAHPAQP